MRQLLPEHRDQIDPVDAYAGDRRDPPRNRPWVLMSMITSIDGATAVGGVSGPLGSPTDRDVLRAVRCLADVILVGAGTARAERYRNPNLSDEMVAARQRRGQHGQPRLAIVSRGLTLDASVPALDGAGEQPIVITTADADPERAAALGERAELMRCGNGSVDVTAALDELRTRHGARMVVAEGGPALNAALAGADALDEVCLTVAPLIAGGPSPRIVHGAEAVMHRFALRQVLEEHGELFLRFVREDRPDISGAWEQSPS